MSATATVNTVDKSAETFRDKILRKCGESVEMKEKFFNEYADEIEATEPRHGEAFHATGTNFSPWEMAAVCATRCISAVEFTHPIIEKRAAFPVIPLMTDVATMTAISNDIDFMPRVRQSTAFARATR